MLWLSSSFLLHEMSHKKVSIIPKRYAWKTLCSSKELQVTCGKNYYLLRNNAKYRNVKSLKGNKVKWSDIRGLWKKKKYSEENIVSIHWQILKLLVLTVPVRQVSLKKSNVIEVNELIVFFVLYSTVLLILVFWRNCFCWLRGSLSNFASMKFMSVKRKFA